jgi:predicted permease
MKLSRLLVRAVARVVPRHDRDAWVAEWLAEITAAEAEHDGGRTPSPGTFALGCVPDAFALRLHGLSVPGLAVDVAHAFRGLVRAPGFTASAVGTLAVGLGTATVLFSMINGIVLRTPPGVEDPDRLVQIGRGTEEAPAWEAFSSRAFERLGSDVESLESVAGWSVHAFNLGEDGRERYVTTHMVTGAYFETLGTRPELGRLIGPSDETSPGDDPVVVLSHDLWVSDFGRDPGVVGRTVLLDGAPFDVVGVTPEGFTGLHNVGTRPQIFVPSTMYTGYQGSLPFESWRWQWLNAFGRLGDDATPETARAELSRLAERLGSMDESQEGTRIQVSRGVGLAPWDRERALRLTGMAGVVCALLFLLTATAVANLVLARSLGRRREIGVRITLGAGRGRVARGLLYESMLISMAASALAVPLALTLDDLLPSIVPLPVVGSMSVDPSVLGFLLLVAVVTGVVMAWGPVNLTTSRGSDDVNPNVRGEPPRHSRLRDGLVVGQLALSMGLVAGAVLLGRSMLNVWSAEPGFDPRGVLATGIQVSTEGDDARARAATYLDALLADLESRDGVRAAAVATQLPIAGGQSRGSFAPVGRPDDEFEGEIVGVAGSYFDVLGVPILRGRGFAGPGDESERVAIVSVSTAELFWPNEDPIGMQLRGDPAWRVVGVVPDARLRSLRADPVPTVYFPIPLTLQGRLQVLVDTEPGAAPAPALVADAVARLGGPEASRNATDLFAAMIDSMGETRLIGYLVAVFAALSLFLSILGLYGLVSYLARTQSREFGVRLTLGASPAQLREIVLRRSLRLAAAGVIGGIAVALATGRILATALYEVEPADAPTLVATAVLLTATSLIAVWIPARRAARTDPVVSLRDA